MVANRVPRKGFLVTEIRQLEYGRRACGAPVTVGLGALGTAAALVTALHVLAGGQLDPLRNTISEYVFVPGGWLLGLSALGIAVAGFATLLGFSRAGLDRPLPVRLAFGALLLGALLAGMFPTDHGALKTVPAYIHQYSSGLLLFGIPALALCAAVAVVRRERMSRYAAMLRSTTGVVAGLLGCFLSAHLSAAPELLRQGLGLFERVLYLAELVLLGQLVYLPRRLLRGAR